MLGMNGSNSATQQQNSLFQRLNWEEIWAPPLTLAHHGAQDHEEELERDV
jgi:hypothetical protein